MGNQTSGAYNEDENVNLVNLNLTKLPFTPSSDNKTRYLNLSGNNILSLPKSMKNITLIDLSSNKLGPSLPPDVATALSSYSNLRNLSFKRNQLENLENFEGKNIDTLILIQNRFRELPYQFLSKFPKLKTLYLDCNFLTTFSKQMVDSIITLSLSLNCLQTIEVATLNLPQLMFLTLSKNQIRKLPNNFSKSFANLKNLDLSDNFITEIPDDESFFPKSLTDLNLANNMIEKVTKSITSLPNLSLLDITNNKITSVPQLNPSITKFLASHNQISHIEKQELIFLNEIYLDYNELTVYPTEILHPKANKVFLSHNKITELNSSAFLINNYLISIDLSFNQLESIPKDLFECYPNLQSFSICFNNVTEIPPEISFCQNLLNLSISFNPIKKLPKLPRSICIFYASNCLIESFSEYSFADKSETPNVCLSLNQLDLSGNKIESIPIIPSVRILNLSQNKITKMPVLTENIKILDLSMNQLESNVNSMPLDISSPTLVDLNLSHNKLTKIPQLRNSPLLQYLELSGNPIESKFDVTSYPFLERIDISETNISIVGQNAILNEIITSKKNDSDDGKCIYVNINKSGYSEILGLRSNMEDSIILRDDLNLYAVFDGHGGPQTAKFGAIEMSNLFEEKIKSNQLNFNNSSRIFLDIFRKVEEGIKTNNFKDGSTLCLALICKNDSGNRKILTAHLGDARALIVQSDGKSRELTKDHKPSSRSEFERIHNIHGFLSKDNRVDGILAVSRSIGDFNVYGVGREPDLNEFEINENDKYLVICCDGVFDVLSNDDVAKVAINCSSANEAAFKIRNTAYGCRSSDNISAIVIDLKKKKKFSKILKFKLYHQRIVCKPSHIFFNLLCI